MLGSPNSRQKGQGAMSRVVPKGTSQTFSPLSRSTAISGNAERGDEGFHQRGVGRAALGKE
jgi:hypothetical protein